MQVHVIWLILCWLISSVSTFNVSSDASVQISLSANVPNSCTWKAYIKPSIVSSYDHISTPTIEGISVFVHYPSQQEVVDFNQLPDILSRANPALGLGNVKCKPAAEAWASSNDSSWQLSGAHPRNNKTNCVRVSIEAGQRPVKLYSELTRGDISTFYVIRAERAIVHDAGSPTAFTASFFN